MMKTASKPLGIALIVVGAFVIIGVMTFAGPCVHDDGSVSTCAQASWGIVAGGLFLIGAAIALMVFANRTARIVFAVICALLGLLIVLMPGTILPLCMMDTMHCQAVMKPFAQICGAIAIILGVVAAVVAARH